MKQVDFYLISNAVADAKYKLASRLSNKLQRLHQKTLLLTDDSPATEKLDDLMWSFSEVSFLAHDRLTLDAGSSAKSHATTLIAEGSLIAEGYLNAEGSGFSPDQIDGSFEVLINLSQAIPSFCHHFDRIAEVVEADEDSKVRARQRFKQYKEEGYEIKTHNIEL